MKKPICYFTWFKNAEKINKMKISNSILKFLLICIFIPAIGLSQGTSTNPQIRLSEIKGTTFVRNANGNYTPQVEIFKVIYINNNISKLTSNLKEINFLYI